MILSASQAKPILLEILDKNKLSVFAGSGISVDSGLPAWDGFIDKYIEICEKLNNSVNDDLKFQDIIDDAKKYKQKSLIDTITALKDKVKNCQLHGASVNFFDDELNKMFYSAFYNEYHKLLVSTNYNQIITTNYDSLLEDAANREGYISLLPRSYSYAEAQKLAAAVYSEETAIIHAHGRIADLKLDQFVLTKHDYQMIMKHNPGFRMIINTIFMTNSILFVGYGGSDPHFEDILDELNFSLKWEQNSSMLPKCFIMMKNDKISPIREYLNDSNRVDIISFETFPQMKIFLADLQSAYPRKK